MAFTMKNPPFRQTPLLQSTTIRTKPVEPDYSLAENQGTGTEMVNVVQGKPRNRIINEEIENMRLAAGDKKFSGDVSTTEKYTDRNGSWLNNVFTGDGYSVTKATGNANTTAKFTGNTFSNDDEKEDFYSNLKTILKEGKGAQIVDGQVTSGGTHQKEVTYDKGKRLKATYNQDLKNYENLEKKDKHDADLATRRAELEAKKTASIAKTDKFRTDKETAIATRIAERDANKLKLIAEREAAANTKKLELIAKREAADAAKAAKKNGGNQSTTNEPVAQQRSTPFYQRGMASDKMLLQNKNKIMSKSPLEQGKNPSSGETLQEKVNRLAQEALQRDIEGKPLGGSEDTRNQTVTLSETTKGKKVEKQLDPKDKKAVEAWKNASKENKEKYLDQTVTATGTASDTGKDNEIKIEIDEDKDKIPNVITEEAGFSTNSGSIKRKVIPAKDKSGFSGMFNSTKTNKIGCPGGCP